MDEETQAGQPGADRVVCAQCETAANGRTAPPTWSCSLEDGVRRYLCDDCARAHIRAIESRLDPDWW
ncbi:hypothetical protein [Streptomyces sp. NPDC048560]|uniref:hypothetical protein n=1 Tax=Streptomyces sp. NPDC048560 TaxID=3155488 RepID=UPI0034266270